MGPRLAICLLLLNAGPGEARSAPVDDLEPEEGVFAGYSEPAPYDLLLRRALFENDRYRLCQLVVMPSFASEAAVYMTRGDERESPFTVISRTLKKQLWGRVMKALERKAAHESFKLDSASQLTALQKLRTAVETRTAQLDAVTGERLVRVCANVLMRVRYPRMASHGADGTTYHAGHWIPGAFLAGKTWSPEEGSLAANFVAMELALKEYAESSEGQRSVAKGNLIRATDHIERQLAARIGAEPANQKAFDPAAGKRRLKSRR